MANPERSLLNENHKPERISQVRRMRKAYEDELAEAKFNPTSALNVVARVNLSVENGHPREVLEGSTVNRVLTLVEGFEQFSSLTFRDQILCELEAILFCNFADVMYLGLTDISEKDIVQTIKGLVVDGSDDAIARIARTGMQKGIRSVLYGLGSPVEDPSPLEEEIDKITTPIYMDEGNQYNLSTNVEGVDVSYFYPLGDVEPSVSLVIRNQ